MSTNKPDLTRVWAATAPGANVIDPDTTTPGKVTAGWQAEVPPFEHFNFLQNWFTAGLAHANEQGIMVWDTDTTYPVNGLAKGSDGSVYEAIIEQNGNDPTSDDTNWHIYGIAKTFNQLKSIEPSADGQVIFLSGNIELGVGAGNFIHVSADVTSVDDNGVTAVTPNQKRWIRDLSDFSVTPQMFGIDGVTVVDAWSVLQYMFDTFRDIFFPAGVYYISTTLQHRRNNNPTIRGTKGDRFTATIKTLPAFVGRRMFCNWDLAWYAEGGDTGAALDVPPSNINTTHSADWSRYINLNSIGFNIDTPTVETELISCVDISEAHETADFHGLIFNAADDFLKGSCFRLFGSQGGWEISHVTCYSENWEHQLHCNLSTSSLADIIVKRWLTSTRPCTSEPFKFEGSWGKVSLYDIHIETHALDGGASFDTESRSFTIDGLWKTYTALETGPLVRIRNPNGSGFGSSGPVLQDLRLTGSTDVDVDIMDSSSQAASFDVVIPRKSYSGQQTAHVDYLSELMFRGSDGNGRRLADIDKSYQSFSTILTTETVRLTAQALKSRLVNIDFTASSTGPSASNSGRIVLADTQGTLETNLYLDDSIAQFTIDAWDRVNGTLDLAFTVTANRSYFNIRAMLNDNLQASPEILP